MKLTLRNLALGATILAAGALTAQVTVQQNWIQQGLPGDDGAVRSGSGFGGKCYITNGTELYTVDANGFTLVKTMDAAMNKGLAIDEAGNIIVAGWPTSANNWANVKLISADFETVTDLTLLKPTESEWEGNRYDVVGNAIGDFMSEEGGLFYLTANTQTYPIPVWIQGGEPVELEYSTAAEFSAANTMASAVPSVTSMADVNDENVQDLFYYRTGSMLSQIGYVNEDGEAAFLTVPAADQLPTDWALQSQNGFAVFTLGGERYQIRMAAAGVWPNNWVMSDDEGNVVYVQEYTDQYLATGKTGNGCNLIARQITENKVELYQIYATNTAAAGFCAMYTISLPEAEPDPLYLAGAFQSWNPAEPAQFTYADGKYTYAYTQTTPGGLKMSKTFGTWDEFNAGVIGVEGNVLSAGGTFNLVAGNANDFSIANGEYTFVVDLEAMTITVEGEAYPFVAPELYVRGGLNEWGTTDKMTSDLEVVDDYVTYTWTSNGAVSGEFKIADADWNVNFGGAGAISVGEYVVYQGGDNMTMDFEQVTLTFMLPAVDGKDAILKAEVPVVAPERKPFATNLSGEQADGEQYIVTFNATGAAEKAIVYVYDAEGNVATTAELEGVVAGTNTLTVDLTEVAEGTYTWSVGLVATGAAEAEIVYQAPEEWMDGDQLITGGVVFIKSVEADAYGYMVVGMGKAHGYAVYTPEGNMVGEGRFQVGDSRLTPTNASSTTRGDALGGLAVFADWSDKASGFWVFDPLNPEQPIRNMLMVEGAEQNSVGAVTYNGVQTGSGSPTVAFQGTGADTKMFSFDEDIYANTLVRYDLGENTSIVAAPTMVLTDYAGKMINTNIEVEAISNGFFVSQNRADGNAQGVPGVMWFDNEGTLLWQSPDGMLDAYSSGIAVSRDEKLMAISRYNGYISFFDLAFDDYNEPVLTYKYEAQLPMTSYATNNRSWMQLTFDDANNLHVYSRTTGGYAVLALPGETTSNTPAKAQYEIVKVSALNGVSVDEAAPAVYYNLQGVQVNAENLTPGIYVRQQGNVATKVVIR